MFAVFPDANDLTVKFASIKTTQHRLLKPTAHLVLTRMTTKETGTYDNVTDCSFANITYLFIWITMLMCYLLQQKLIGVLRNVLQSTVCFESYMAYVEEGEAPLPLLHQNLPMLFETKRQSVHLVKRGRMFSHVVHLQPPSGKWIFFLFTFGFVPGHHPFASSTEQTSNSYRNSGCLFKNVKFFSLEPIRRFNHFKDLQWQHWSACGIPAKQ